MTDIEALRARMRELAEADLHAIRAAAEVQPSVNVDSKLLLALDAEITRLREDLDRVTRERDEAQSTVRQATAAVRVAEMRAEAAEAALAKRDEEVAKLPRVTALLRHLVQVFDAGGESCGRSMRAGFAEEAFDILHRDDPAYLIEYDRCQYDPIEYLMERRRAEAKALSKEPTNAE